MDFDIALVLVILTFGSGLIWLLDKWLWESDRRAGQRAAIEAKGEKITEEERDAILADPVLVDYSRSLFPIFLLVLVLRSFVFEPFRIPSQSMMPTLWVGDFILVNKFSYGIRLPVLNTEIVDTGKPQNGDVVVFRYPVDPAINFIKRVIGVPGDHIVYQNKVLYVNGKIMPQKANGPYQGEGSGQEMNGALLRQETLAGKEHDILIVPELPEQFPRYDRALTRGNNIDFVVPEGHYFVMGDNRDKSHDSRFWGLVPVDNLVGKAFMIWFNWDAGHAFFWDRIGTNIE